MVFMTQPHDMKLWTLVKKTITPLGQPRPSQPTSMAISFSYGENYTALDLHGYTIQEAHSRVQSFIDRAAYAGQKGVTIITGKSGGIRKEFPTWAMLHSKVRSIEELNGGGAFYVKLKTN
jgi:dsDNA-specific endonuclease/ATPase MutS2